MEDEEGKEQVFRVLWEFVCHAFLITTAFLILFLAALGLHRAGEWMIEHGWYTLGSFPDALWVGAGYMIAGADATMFIALIVIRGYRSVRKF